MTVGITELPPEGMQLGGVALAGDAERGTKTTEGLSLLFTTAGITVQGPQPQIERLLVWSGLDTASCREKISLPDGRNAAVMELTSGGQSIRFLLPMDSGHPWTGRLSRPGASGLAGPVQGVGDGQPAGLARRVVRGAAGPSQSSSQFNGGTTSGGPPPGSGSRTDVAGPEGPRRSLARGPFLWGGCSRGRRRVGRGQRQRSHPGDRCGVGRRLGLGSRFGDRLGLGADGVGLARPLTGRSGFRRVQRRSVGALVRGQVEYRIAATGGTTIR